MKNYYSIGLDIHGVIDRNPKLFKKIIERLREAGHSVFILTGHPVKEARVQLHKWGIYDNQILSIVDYHRDMGTASVHQEKTGWWMDKDVWDRTKSEFARLMKLDIHIDDQVEYGVHFPKTCKFIHFDRTQSIEQQWMDKVGCEVFLKGCPHCGSVADYGYDGLGIYVNCTCCGASFEGLTKTIQCATMSERMRIAQKWNRRVS